VAITVTLTRQPMKDGSTRLKLLSPYSPDAPADCRAIGGKWNATIKAWLFDERDANRVRDLCVKHWGIDPLAEADEAPELVTVRYHVGGLMTGDQLWLFGRELARQPSRDANPRLGQGVILVRGSFRGGGSRNNPDLRPSEDCLLEIRDVPRTLVDPEIAALQARVEKARARTVELELEQADLAAQLEAIGQVEAGSPEAWRRQDITRRWDACRTSIDSQRRIIESADGRLTIVRDAPQAPVVPSGTAQIGALFDALAPEGRRAVIMSMVATLPSSERPAFVKELQQYLDQGAI
jgi:hypothetical protein